MKLKGNEGRMNNTSGSGDRENDSPRFKVYAKHSEKVSKERLASSRTDLYVQLWWQLCIKGSRNKLEDS